MLGVHISPDLNWKIQFNTIIDKMKTTVAKLKKITINTYLTYIVFNIYMMKNVYFDCGIIELNKW